MQLLVILVLVGHTAMHFGAVFCGPLFESTAPSIAAITGVDAAVVKAIAIVLTSITVAGYLLALLSGRGVLLPRRWWGPLVVVASVASAVVLVGSFEPPAVPGLAIDAVLVAVVLVRSWQPGGRARTAPAAHSGSAGS